MKQRLRPLPVRVRLALSLLLLVLAFFLAWWSTGWAWPTRELAYRALETAHGFGPGEIVAQGEVTFEEGYSNRYTDRPSAWMIGRSGDSFAAAVLEQTPGPLWRACDIYDFQVLTATLWSPPSWPKQTVFSVSLTDSGTMKPNICGRSAPWTPPSSGWR